MAKRWLIGCIVNTRHRAADWCGKVDPIARAVSVRTKTTSRRIMPWH